MSNDLLLTETRILDATVNTYIYIIRGSGASCQNKKKKKNGFTLSSSRTSVGVLDTGVEIGSIEKLYNQNGP